MDEAILREYKALMQGEQRDSKNFKSVYLNSIKINSSKSKGRCENIYTENELLQ